MARAEWWVLVLFLALTTAAGFYFLPGVCELESMETARRAETRGGRLRMVAPGAFWTLLAAPGAAVLTYRSGKRLSIRESRRVALAVGLLIVFCSFSGAGLFVIGKQAYLFPFWGFVHLGRHRLASAVASACPFCR